MLIEKKKNMIFWPVIKRALHQNLFKLGFGKGNNALELIATSEHASVEAFQDKDKDFDRADVVLEEERRLDAVLASVWS